tara:strand:+ start:2578 stop:2904 length:327 start_codon:yes stop_codon:yes gene_type:complete
MIKLICKFKYYKNMSSDNKVFYYNLKKLLKETSSWPSKYIFKFIFREDNDQSKIIREIFSNSLAEFIVKLSKNGKYISLSVSLIANNPDYIIKKYIEVSEKTENVILL